METLPFNEFTRRIAEVFAGVHARHEPLTVTDEGLPPTVLMSLDDYERMQETMAVMSDPELIKAIDASRAENAQGVFTTHEDMSALMQSRFGRSSGT